MWTNLGGAGQQERKLLGLRVNKLEHSTVNIEPTEKAEHNPILLEICKRKLANAYACKLNALPLKEQNKPTPEEFNANLVELYKTAQYLKLIFEGEYLENELDKSANNLTR